MRKKLLCVTYGGGHARMVIPVIRALADCAEIDIVTLALTGAGPIFKSENLPFLGFKDFLTSKDSEALVWGKKLAAIHHSPESGIAEEESIAYLGLSYWDLVVRHGEVEAARLWVDKGRHAFFPLSIMERVIEKVKPDMVLVTNSPRAEEAAVEVAKRCGVATMAMVDLFGLKHFHTIIADFITVLCPLSIDNMRAEGVDKPDDAFLVTGNPAFDLAFDYRGPIDYDYRRKYFPTLSPQSPWLLWIDTPAYWMLENSVFHNNELHVRTDTEIIRDLDDLSHAAKVNGAYLLVRPHPSQSRALYDQWFKDKPQAHVAYAGGFPLYPLLKSVDVVSSYNSTVAVEALLMERRVLKLKYHLGESDTPLGRWKLAWRVEHPDDLPTKLDAALHDEEEWKRMQERITAFFPQEKAAPKVAEHIKRIVLEMP